MPDFFEAETTYTVKMKAELQGKEGEWSEEAEFITLENSECCVWKECPGYVDVDRSILLMKLTQGLQQK